MKLKSVFLFLILTGSIAFTAMKKNIATVSAGSLDGAWYGNNGNDFNLLFADNYCIFTQYNTAGSYFVETFGGPVTIKKDKIQLKIEFNSLDSTQLGKTIEYSFFIKNNKLVIEDGGLIGLIEWKHIDTGNNNLAGNWYIVKRKQGNEVIDIPLRARRTLKLLTGTRFQWVAMNVETGVFSGTGGGIYTYKGGKYTEYIEFFSRDSSRVGMSLSFDGKLENNNWIHAGKSSKGDPVYEVWRRMK